MVSNEIFTDQTAANMVLLAIDSGNKDWLNLAMIILKNTENPRTHKMIIMSLGEALQWKPKEVFDISSKWVGIEHLCGLEGVYEWRLMSQFLALQAIQRRLSRIELISDFKYAKVKKQCIDQLLLSKKKAVIELTNLP